MAKAYLIKGDSAGAREYAEAVLKENPKSVEAHFVKGKILLKNKNGMDAVSEFRTVVTDQPGYIPAYLGLAEAHVMNQELDLAKDTLNNALKMAPDSRDVLRALARVYVLKKDYAGAEAQLRKILENHPNDPQVQAELGDLLAAQKDFKGSEEQYEAIKNTAPESPAGYLKLAQMYLRQKKPDQAIQMLEARISGQSQVCGVVFESDLFVHLTKKVRQGRSVLQHQHRQESQGCVFL